MALDLLSVGDLMQFYLGRQQVGYGLNIAPMHDVCAIVPYVDDSLLQFLHTSVRIELTGTHTRGMTVCDLRHPKGSAEPSLRNRSDPNVLLAVEVRSRALIDRVIDTILDYA